MTGRVARPSRDRPRLNDPQDRTVGGKGGWSRGKLKRWLTLLRQSQGKRPRDAALSRREGSEGDTQTPGVMSRNATHSINLSFYVVCRKLSLLLLLLRGAEGSFVSLLKRADVRQGLNECGYRRTIKVTMLCARCAAVIMPESRCLSLGRVGVEVESSCGYRYLGVIQSLRIQNERKESE